MSTIHNTNLRTPSPNHGQQIVRGQERKGPSSSPVVNARASTGSLIKPQTSRLTPRDSDGSQGLAAFKPSSNLKSNNRSPVPPSMSHLKRSPNNFQSTMSDKNVTIKPNPKRAVLAQGSVTSIRQVGFASAGMNAATGTPRSQFQSSEVSCTPRGQGALHNPSVVVNRYFDGSQKVALAPGTLMNKSNSVAANSMDEPHDQASGRRVLGFARDNQRKSVSGSPVYGVQNAAASSLDSARSFKGVQWLPVQDQKSNIQSSILLLQQSQLFQSDPVLRDLLRMIVSRINTSHQQQRQKQQNERVIVTSDSATQVQTVEAFTQTEAAEFQERRLKANKLKNRRLDGQGCSLSDSDVPSDANDDARSASHRRRNSLDDISLSTNSPRESCDGYSRDLSDASGPISVSSMVQMSIASSTDASQTNTLAHDQTSMTYSKDFYDEHADHRGAHMDECLHGHDHHTLDCISIDETINSFEAVDLNKTKSPVGTDLLADADGCEFEIENSVYGSNESPTETAATEKRANSPPPSIETLMELQKILDDHYKKLWQSGSYAGNSLYRQGTPIRFDGINSPATAEMLRLTMESQGQSLDELRQTPERPPNPDPTKWSPNACFNAEVPGSIRMGNSPPKHNVQMPLRQLRHVPVPSLKISAAISRSEQAPVESPLSTPRSGSAFLAHVNSARSSTNSASE
uniref:Uncharacterized protein n=1 Tax=Guillardia theta TaxID=55529 RepID=A0A7S4PEK9_GUITH|mmetsp:Transcript_49304/g.154663  ORF Transcript_49304/g.154663 Transcript_49304/m.154663 type:complete len:687 (+) Transcript_49304:111-2171(+)